MATVIELNAETVAFVTVIVGAVGSVVGYVFNRKDKNMDKYVDKLEKENDAYRLRLDAMQDRQFQMIQSQAAIDRERADVNQHFARTVEGHTKLLSKLVKDE